MIAVIYNFSDNYIANKPETETLAVLATHTSRETLG